jgi:hypothetical protein
MMPRLRQGGYIHPRVHIIPWRHLAGDLRGVDRGGTRRNQRTGEAFRKRAKFDTAAAEEISPSDMNPPSCSLISDWHIRG